MDRSFSFARFGRGHVISSSRTHRTFEWKIFLSVFISCAFASPHDCVLTVYEKHGSTCLSSVKLWNAQVFYWFADAEALKSVADDRYTFQKDVVAVSGPSFLLFSPWGPKKSLV